MLPPDQIILQAIEGLGARIRRPIVVALDGGSGAGKSTIAAKLKAAADVAIVSLDDFYQISIPEEEWVRKTVTERLSGVFEWSRVRAEAIEPLRDGRPGRWHAFDFLRGLSTRGTYELSAELTHVAPTSTLVLDGAYSASSFLADLVDIAVLVNASTRVRHERLADREGESPDFLAGWHEIWDDVEDHYFNVVCPPESFDLEVANEEIR